MCNRCCPSNNNNKNATINVQHKSKRRRSKLYDKQTTSRTRSERIRRAVPRNHYMPSHSDMFIGNLWFCWAHKLKSAPNTSYQTVLAVVSWNLFFLHITIFCSLFFFLFSIISHFPKMFTRIKFKSIKCCATKQYSYLEQYFSWHIINNLMLHLFHFDWQFIYNSCKKVEYLFWKLMKNWFNNRVQKGTWNATKWNFKSFFKLIVQICKRFHSFTLSLTFASSKYNDHQITTFSYINYCCTFCVLLFHLMLRGLKCI